MGVAAAIVGKILLESPMSPLIRTTCSLLLIALMASLVVADEEIDESKLKVPADAKDQMKYIERKWDSNREKELQTVKVCARKLKESVPGDEDLQKKIRTKIRTGASPRHVPARIVAVTDIPRTKSGKITELAVRDIVHGRVVKNQEALANPEALDLYKDLPELRE